MGNNEFHSHLDICSQCRDHPFYLCPTGAKLLKEVAGTQIKGMTLEEAIGKIEAVLKGASAGQRVVMDIAALQLGVEALKRIKDLRDGVTKLYNNLPGEIGV